MAFTLAQAKSLCTAGELSLVKASTRNEIGKLSVVRVRQKVDRARKLRDKWFDQSRSQRRAAQSAHRARQVGANARSAEKAELFGEVLARFEAQLTKLESKGEKSRPAPKRLPKRARSATHRAGRADVRAELKEERAALGGRKKPKPPAATKSRRPATELPEPAPGETETTEAPAALTRPPKRTAGQGKLATSGVGLTALESARAVQGLRVTKSKQLRAATTAKQDRLKAAGKRRIQMHASARGRRNQGKRDAR